MLLLDTNILIDVLRGEAAALEWLEQQEQPGISVISWIEVLTGCRDLACRSMMPSPANPYC